MFDEQRVAVMRYDEQERFVEAAEPTEPIEVYIARRDLAMKYVVPFEQWMADHRDRMPYGARSATTPRSSPASGAAGSVSCCFACGRTPG